MTDSTQPTTTHTTARYFLEGLQETGIRYLFSNLGTDHVTLIDEMARLQAEGQAMPEVVLCPHENVAIHMAGGYAAVTGQGQGVMVHVDAGTANAAMGMHNLMRARLPVLLMAGKAPYALHGEVPGARDNYVHYVQDPFDIASLALTSSGNTTCPRAWWPKRWCAAPTASCTPSLPVRFT
jgi:acetolactate synthase-1/2/3 large subunit